MIERWQFAPDVPPAWRRILQARFDPAHLRPLAGTPARSVSGRTYGRLTVRPDLPFDVFVKGIAYGSVGSRAREALGCSGAHCEFERAIRLRAAGLPVPRPLALARTRAGDGRVVCHFLAELLEGGRGLSADLAPSSRGEGTCGEASRPGPASLVEALARLIADLAAAGFWHRDLRPENLYVLWGKGGTARAVPPDAGKDRSSVAPAESPPGTPSPGASAVGVLSEAPAMAVPRLFLTDTRHVEVHADPAEAVEGMLVTLGAFLYRDGAEAGLMGAIAQRTLEEAEARGIRGLPGSGAVLDRARRSGADLLARDVRKGRRPQGDLDRFARRYASAADAATYRDRRFGRSRRGRRIDAAERRIIADLLARTGSGPVLDVPCGTGRLFPVLAAAGREVVGGDASPEMLTLARQAAEAAGLACRLAVLDARRLPFPDGSVDLAMAVRLLHRVRTSAERVAVLAELARVSRRWVLFSFYDRRSWRGLRDRLRGRYPGETRARMRRDAAEAGLRVVRFLPVRPLARETIVLCERCGGPGEAG